MSPPETAQISIHNALLIDRNFCILGEKHRDLSRILSASASASCCQSLCGPQHVCMRKQLILRRGAGPGAAGAQWRARSTWRGSSTYWWRSRASAGRAQLPPAASRAALTCAAAAPEPLTAHREHNRPTQPHCSSNSPSEYRSRKITAFKNSCRIHWAEQLVLNVLFPLKCMGTEECVNDSTDTDCLPNWCMQNLLIILILSYSLNTTVYFWHHVHVFRMCKMYYAYVKSKAQSLSLR